MNVKKVTIRSGQTLTLDDFIGSNDYVVDGPSRSRTRLKSLLSLLFWSAFLYNFGLISALWGPRAWAWITGDTPVKMVVLIPFVEIEIRLLKDALTSRWQEHYYDSSQSLDICSPGVHRNVDLVLGYNLDADHPRVKPSIDELVALAKETKCFGAVTVHSFQLSRQEDIHPGGISRMIYRSILEPETVFGSASYDYMQVLEADVLPVQALWLDALYAHAIDAEPFWIKGGMYRGQDWNEFMHETDWWRSKFMHWGNHINGVALYTLQSDTFKIFVKETMESYPPDGKFNPYDTALMMYYQDATCMSPSYLFTTQQTLSGAALTQRLKCARLRESTLTNFRYSSVVMNLGASIDTVGRSLMNANVYMVHGQTDSITQRTRIQQNND